MNVQTQKTLFFSLKAMSKECDRTCLYNQINKACGLLSNTSESKLFAMSITTANQNQNQILHQESPSLILHQECAWQCTNKVMDNIIGQTFRWTPQQLKACIEILTEHGWSPNDYRSLQHAFLHNRTFVASLLETGVLSVSGFFCATARLPWLMNPTKIAHDMIWLSTLAIKHARQEDLRNDIVILRIFTTDYIWEERKSIFKQLWFRAGLDMDDINFDLIGDTVTNVRSILYRAILHQDVRILQNVSWYSMALKEAEHYLIRLCSMVISNETGLSLPKVICEIVKTYLYDPARERSRQDAVANAC